jgi:hypothetical protein
VTLQPFGNGPVTVTALAPSGNAAADAAAINAAISSVPAAGGTVNLAAGTWRLAAGAITVARSGVFLSWAPGAVIVGSGTGDLIRMYDPSTYNTRTVNGGGILGSPLFNCSAMGSGSSAFHAGDILGLQAYLQVSFCAGTNGVHLDNNYYWTEQIEADIRVTGCNVRFDQSANVSGFATGSFDRFKGTIWVENQGIADGVLFSGGSFIVDPVDFQVFGNFLGGTAAVWSVIHFDNATSTISYGVIHIGVELDSTTAFPPRTFTFNNGGFVGIHNCSGAMDFSSGSSQFAQSNNGGNFIFAGDVFGDTTLVAMQALSRPSNVQGSSGNNQTFFTGSNGWIRTNPAGAVTGCILQAGSFPSQTVTVVNTGAGTITFAAAGTSNVADGVADVIPALTARTFIWDTTASLWYRTA